MQIVKKGRMVVVAAFLVLIGLAVGQFVLNKNDMDRIKDKKMVALLSNALNLLGGAIIWALIAFDMQLLQFHSYYYVEDFEVIEALDCYAVELNGHGTVCEILLIIGVALTILGLAGMIIVLYKKIDDIFTGSMEASEGNSGPVDDENAQSQSEDWTCKYCGQLNNMISIQCQSCGLYKLR